MKPASKLATAFAPIALSLATACARPSIAPITAFAPPAAASADAVSARPPSATQEPERLASPTSARPPSIASAPSTAPVRAPRRKKGPAATSDFAIELVTDEPGGFAGDTLRVSRCPKGATKTIGEARIVLPANATGFGFATAGPTVFAAGYFSLDRDAQPTSSRVYALDQRLRLVREIPVGSPRTGDIVSSLSIAADDRYLVTYENDGQGLDTATVQLRDATSLAVIAKATVGASHALGHALRHRLVLLEDDLYVLAPLFPARRVRSTGNKVLFSAEEYVVTRLSLPTLAPIAQALTGRHELGDLPLTFEGGRLRIEDEERIDTFTLDLKTQETREIPPRNAPPPVPKKACGER